MNIRNVKSQRKEIGKGVPQGSTLGTLIVNSYINDLFYFVKRWSLFSCSYDNSVSVDNKELDIVRWLLQSEAEVSLLVL